MRKPGRDQRASLPQQLPNELMNCGKVVRAWEFNSSTSKCRRNGQVFNVVDVDLSALPTGVTTWKERRSNSKAMGRRTLPLAWESRGPSLEVRPQREFVLLNPSMDCSKTVPKPNHLSSFGLALSEKQIPQIVENNESRTDRMEPLEATGVRPRQVRYQAALRPD
jgi:hypothetical protein